MVRILGVALLGGLLFGDTLVMKNGDKLSGTYVTTTDKGVIFRSEFAGEVTVELANIGEVRTEQLITVTGKDGKVITGKVVTSGSEVAVTPLDGQPVTLALADVSAVRSLEGQATFEDLERRKLHPEFLDLYTGFYDFGIAFARGNAITDAYSSNAKLNRVTAKDNFGIYFTQIRSSATIDDVSTTTANATRGGWNYSRQIGADPSRWFVQGFNDYEYDAFLGLDLRVVLGGGLGYYLIKNDRGFLTVSGGASWNREKFNTGLLRNSTEVYAAQEWVYKLGRIWAVNEKFVIFPNVSNTGSYRMNFDASLAAALSRILSLQFSISDRYLSNPLPGRKSNDVLFSAGIRASIPTREK